MALPVNEYLFAIIIAQLSIKLPLLADAQTGLVPYSATSCSAASNGGHPICAFLSQVRVFRKDQNNNIINKDFKPRGYPSGNDSRIARSSG
jgi:hypothetical protein